MGMPTDEAQSFLAEPHVAVIAVDEPGGPPLAVPVWYGYTPGDDLWLLTGTGSVKARLLRSAGRCTLTVDTVSPRTRYVSVGCDVTAERPGTEDDRRVIAERYLSGEQLQSYLAFAAQSIGSEAVFVLRATRWRSADLTLS